MRWIGCSDLAGSSLVDGLAPGWCGDPGPDADVPSRFGVVACRAEVDRDLLARRLRARGIDPLGVAFVDLEDWEREDAPRIRARMAAASARVDGHQETPIDHLRLHMPPVVSRRTFLRFRAPSYRVVPRPDPSRCAAGNGCRACVPVCPHGALDWVAGRIDHDRLACESCGRCLTACPAGAIAHPSFVPERVQAQIAAFAGVFDGAFGVEFHCARSPAPTGTAGWLQVELPCVGMAPPHWLVGPLLLGASAASLSACTCRAEDDGDARRLRTVAAARSLLESSGLDANRVVDEPAEAHLSPRSEPRMVEAGFGPAGAAAVGAALPAVDWTHELAAAGVITIDAAACTGCEMCATVCPSGALESLPDAERLSVRFDAALCTACGQCVARCPEPGAIAITPLIDSAAIARGPHELVGHEMARCRHCGGSVAPVATLERLHARLEDDATFAHISTTCIECRGGARALV